MRKIPLFLLLTCASTLSGCGEESASNLPAVNNQPRVKLKALSPSLGEFPDAELLAYAYAFEQATKLRVTPARIGGP